MKRVFLIVLDSLGIGQMPDAKSFNDYNCNTLKRISSSSEFKVDNLMKLGLSDIEGIDYLKKCSTPMGAFGRLTEASKGKDTTIGHWEISGIISNAPMPTYPDGFPKEILEEFSKRTGRGVLCNKPYSGTKVIMDYGKEHIKSGDLIVYTSADSVFQIAAHEEIVPIKTLYEYCKIAREILTGKNAVGRVIARPFAGKFPDFVRTSNRHDFSLLPPKDTMLDAINKSKKTVYAIGKIYDIFAGKGITKYVFTHSNTEGMTLSCEALREDFEGICFINLVDFDMMYGHRQDIDGYARALSEFDAWLPNFLNSMKQNDILIITADHGCDPGDNSTDHTREYTPLIVYGKNVSSKNLGTRKTFADIAATVCDYLKVEYNCDGKSFLSEIIKGE